MVDPRTPVIVGVGLADQHGDDPTELVEALSLMVRAAEQAIGDSGAPDLGQAVDLVAVPGGSWGYRDAGRLVGERIGAAAPTTVHAEIGIVQQDLLTLAAEQIASGDIEVALVVGGEARHREVRAKVTATTVEETSQADDVHPDTVLSAESMGIADLEMTRNLVTPAVSYALMENALAHARGRTPDEHRAVLGALEESFAAVARGNPCAWDRSGPSAEEIVTPSADNRMISSPYTKVMCSQWNVDQAAAVLVCSAEAAARFAVAPDRWVFLHGATVSNHTVPVIQRADLHRSVGAEVAARRVLELAGIGADDLAHVDLYSCFPLAVQVYADALGLPLPGVPLLGAPLADEEAGDGDGGDGGDGGARPLTVTGGMSFGGGPLNNYVLQAFAVLVERLRGEPGSFGLSSSVSGYLNKQAFSIWSTTAPTEGPWPAIDDVTDDAAEADIVLPVHDSFTGVGTIAGWTVEHLGGEPHRAVVVVDVDLDGVRSRTLASTGDADTCAAMLSGDWIGTRVDVRDDGSFRLEA